MLREGPIPAFLHGLYEYLGGAALIAAPLLIPYHHGATAPSIVLGVLVIVMAATTHGPTSLVNQVPISVHVLLDYVLAGLLIAAPFLFDFSKDATPTAVFIGAGVLHLLVSIGTRFKARAPTTPAVEAETSGTALAGPAVGDSGTGEEPARASSARKEDSP